MTVNSFKTAIARRVVTSRLVLHVGYACNLRCRFCYYLEDLKRGRTRDWTTDQLKRRLRIGRRLGKTAVDLTGGEPSIRSDILELISYARSIGYSDVNMITNGLRLSDPGFCADLVAAGLNDILYSIHSPLEAEHDYLTCVKGSYRKIFQALENMQQLGVRGRVNSVVSNINYTRIDQFLGLMEPYAPAAVNLIVFNPAETTVSLPEDDGTRVRDYRDIAGYLDAALSTYRDRFPALNIRFFPFCLLPNHLDLIRTQWQKMYEDVEWDPVLNICYQKGWWAALGAFGAGLLLYPLATPKFGRRDLYTWVNEVVTTLRIKLYYRQTEACAKCSLRRICTGLPVDYVRRFDQTELSPIVLPNLIDDPLYFCRDREPEFASLRAAGQQEAH